MPAVTVVITSYKLERYIARCLDELFSQSMQDFDVVVIDDASPDRTGEIVRAYMEKYPGRMRALFLEKNLGSPAKTRNAAIESGMLDGEYTLFLDGDDRIEPDCLETLYQKARETGADVVVSAYERVEEGTEHVLCRELAWLPEKIPLPPQSDAVAFLNSALWNKLIKTELCLACRLPDFRVGEDLCYSLSLMQKANGVACVPRVLQHYYARKGSVMSSAAGGDGALFAAELANMYASATPEWKEVLALVSFLHIALSMPLSVSKQPGADLKAYCKKTRAHLISVYELYRGRKYLSFCSLIRHGAKGLCLYFALLACRMGLILPMLSAYRLLSRLFHIEIKF